MCSTQCETPVVPGSSLRPPTRYHIHTPTSGRSRTSRRITRRPLSSVVCWKDAEVETDKAIGLMLTSVGFAVVCSRFVCGELLLLIANDEQLTARLTRGRTRAPAA